MQLTARFFSFFRLRRSFNSIRFSIHLKIFVSIFHLVDETSAHKKKNRLLSFRRVHTIFFLYSFAIYSIAIWFSLDNKNRKRISFTARTMARRKSAKEEGAREKDRRNKKDISHCRFHFCAIFCTIKMQCSNRSLCVVLLVRSLFFRHSGKTHSKWVRKELDAVLSGRAWLLLHLILSLFFFVFSFTFFQLCRVIWAHSFWLFFFFFFRFDTFARFLADIRNDSESKV